MIAMRERFRRRKQILFSYWIGWVLAFLFMATIRGVGTIEKGSIQWELERTLAVSAVFGVVFGTVSGLIQMFAEERLYKRTSLLRMLLTRLLFSVLFLALLITVSYFMATGLFDVQIGFVEFVIEPGSFAIYFYIFCVDVFMTFLSQVNLMMGEGNLAKLLSGRFYSPREEIRIFMFLDLRSSTELAEQLGHEKYSRLIQDCFNDLGIVVAYGAEIYQYVGDEAVLTWPVKRGLRNNNCIEAYFAFSRHLKNRQRYYEQTYGIQPFFKAGVHVGQVMVTEVGKYKKEIAYHGDTMNTTARIQAQCNTYQRGLLISGVLKDQLTGYSFRSLGKVTLRGKSAPIEVFSLQGDNERAPG